MYEFLWFLILIASLLGAFNCSTAGRPHREAKPIADTWRKKVWRCLAWTWRWWLVIAVLVLVAAVNLMNNGMRASLNLLLFFERHAVWMTLLLVISLVGFVLAWRGELTMRRLVGAAVMGAVVINHEVSDRVRAEEALRESAHHLQQLSRQLMDVQEDERRHLARELHDRLGATLTALSINLVALKNRTAMDREAQARVDDSTTLVKSTALAMENLVADLRPPMLDEHGLAAALRWYGRQFAGRVGVAVTVQPIAPGLHVTPEARIALFRIAQEALNNVAKHARAKRVAINLRRTEGEFMMSISDDGIGLPKDEDLQHSGLGMTSMRERAQAVGGRFEIERLPEGGTRLTVRVPR